MKKAAYLFVVLFVLAQTAVAQQNHVLNGSFEYYTQCPTFLGQVRFCEGWQQPTNATSDFFHSCFTDTGLCSVPDNYFGYQLAADGNGYVGVAIATGDFRDYVATRILPLEPGCEYEVSISVSLSDDVKYASNGLGVFFYDTTSFLTSTISVLPVIPQVLFPESVTDRQNWTRLSQRFIADSAYDNIVIGSFYGESAATYTVVNPTGKNYAHYYIDSVVVKKVDSLKINIGDSIFCIGDTLTILCASPAAYNTNNIFTAQLSDAAGSFNNPINIGSSSSAIAGSIDCIIPPHVAPGSNYRIRVLSSNKADTSKNTITNITIDNIINPIISNNSPICKNDTLIFSATTITTGVNYSWTGPLGFAYSGSSVAIHATDTAMSGSYIFTISNGACMVTDTIDVVVYTGPDSPIIVSNSPLKAGSSLFLELTNPKPGASFSWTGPNGFKSNLHKPYIATTTQDNAGKYTLTTTLGECTKTAEIDVVILGAKDSATIVLYPNPNNGNFKIEGQVNNNSTIPVGIYSIMGQLIHKQDIIPVNKIVSENITLEGKLSPGIYFVKLVVNGQARIIPITISR